MDYELQLLRRDPSKREEYIAALERVAGVGPEPEVSPPVEIEDGEVNSIESWYAHAKSNREGGMSVDRFMTELEEYPHSYDSAVHAVAACGLAAIHQMSRTMGLTGWQAGFVTWQIWRKYMLKEGPLRLTEFKNMLFPQYADRYQKTMDTDTFKWLQTEAQKMLDEGRGHPNVQKH